MGGSFIIDKFIAEKLFNSLKYIVFLFVLKN
jgi:hypothetical protein